MTSRIRRFRFAAAALPALLSVAPAMAAAAQPESAAAAMAAITRMSDFLTATPAFSVRADIGYDVVQDWGQKIEFGETRVMTVHRPDGLRVDTTDRDGSTSSLVFDGKQIGFADGREKVYATTARPGTITDAVTYIANDLGLRLPMAAILSGHLPALVKGWAAEVDDIDQVTVAGVPCDHIALRGDWEDIQMWIARGDRPLLQRMVITYKRAEGQPQFWAQLSDWNLSPSLSDATFAFTPPAGATRIAFAIETRGGAAPALSPPGSHP